VRDPRGFRPLVLEIDHTLPSFPGLVASNVPFESASTLSTCARSSRRNVRISKSGIESITSHAEAAPQCIFEHVISLAPICIILRPLVNESREMLGRRSRANIQWMQTSYVPVPILGPAAVRYAHRIQNSLSHGFGSASLHRPRTFIEPSQAIAISVKAEI